MLANAFKTTSRLAIALSFAGLAGCASDGGLGEAAAVGALLLPMPANVDPSLVNAAVGVAATTYVVSSVATADDGSVSAVPPADVTASPAQPGTELQALVTRETPDRYRPKSCEYIEIALGEVPTYQASPEPLVRQIGVLRNAAAGQVWAEKGCKTSNLPQGRIGAKLETIDPHRALALSAPSAGVVVLGTLPGSTAQQAGLLPQDVVVAVDSQPVADPIDARVEIAKAAIGSQVKLMVWRDRAFSVIPVTVGPATPQVATAPLAPVGAPAAAVAQPVQAGALYCHAVVATQHTYGATVSPVTLVPGAASGMQPSLERYIAKVKQVQPGKWGTFTFKPGLCAPGAVVCMAEAKGPSGKTQNAFEFCHPTQALAEAEVNTMRPGDPQAVTVEWP